MSVRRISHSSGPDLTTLVENYSSCTGIVQITLVKLVAVAGLQAASSAKSDVSGQPVNIKTHT